MVALFQTLPIKQLFVKAKKKTLLRSCLYSKALKSVHGLFAKGKKKTLNQYTQNLSHGFRWCLYYSKWLIIFKTRSHRNLCSLYFYVVINLKHVTIYSYLKKNILIRNPGSKLSAFRSPDGIWNLVNSIVFTNIMQLISFSFMILW